MRELLGKVGKKEENLGICQAKLWKHKEKALLWASFLLLGNADCLTIYVPISRHLVQCNMDLADRWTCVQILTLPNYQNLGLCSGFSDPISSQGNKVSS